MSYIKIFLFGLLLCALSMPGCSSNTSSSSGSGSGSGFSINLTATQTVLPQGGSTTLIAAIKDAQGNPVNDSATDAVTFTTSLGAPLPNKIQALSTEGSQRPSTEPRGPHLPDLPLVLPVLPPPLLPHYHPNYRYHRRRSGDGLLSGGLCLYQYFRF